MQDEIQHLQTEVEALRSGGAPLESLDRPDGGNPSALMQKREIVRLNEELIRSDAGKSLVAWKFPDRVDWFLFMVISIAREEIRVRCEALEQEIERMRMRQDDLQSAAEQTRSLKV